MAADANTSGQVGFIAMTDENLQRLFLAIQDTPPADRWGVVTSALAAAVHAEFPTPPQTFVAVANIQAMLLEKVATAETNTLN